MGTVRVEIKNKILNIFAALFIVTLFFFAFTWIVFDFQESYTSPKQGLSTSLKDTWSIVSSLFGGIATLAAAYIATKLVANWKDQTKYNEQLALMSSIIRETTTLQLELNKIRHHQPLGIYLCNLTQYLLNRNLNKNLLKQYIFELEKQFPSPNFQHILDTRKRLLDLLLNLKLYANNDIALSNIINSLNIIEGSVIIYSIQLKLVYCDTSIIDKGHCKKSIDDWMEKVFNLSYHASILLKDNHVNTEYDYSNLEVKNLLLDADIALLHLDIIEYRKSLDD